MPPSTVASRAASHAFQPLGPYQSQGMHSLVRQSGSDAGGMCVTRCVGLIAGRRALSAIAITGPRHVRPLSSHGRALQCPKEVTAVSSAALRNVTLVKRRTMATINRPTQIRRDSKFSGPYEEYEAVVVGAGPAGITAVGNLLDNRLDKILWVDDSFNGGRVNEYYREVPSNTKVKLFIDFAQAVSPFRKIVSGIPSRDRYEEPSPSDGTAVEGKSDKLQDLRHLDQEKGCQLSHAADMCLMLTHGLRRTPGVITQKGRVNEVVFDEFACSWTVDVDTESNSPQDTTSVQAKRIVLCTGASPLDPPLPYEPGHLQHINLDVALSPTKLSALLSPLGPTTISVIGASHSAVLVLMNLSQLALSSKPDLKVKWFTRHPLRYAEYEDGFIARDNTGLKGEAAVWARENLEDVSKSPVGKCVTKIAYNKGDEESVYRQRLPDSQFVIQAIGYSRNAIPTIRSETGETIEPFFDHDKGVFNYKAGGSVSEVRRLPGLYGAGIAFPQRVFDKKYGHEEFNVGFFKFMKAVKQWVAEWKADPSASSSK